MADKLTGPTLEDALAARGLPSEGNAEQKRAAIAQFDAENENSVTEPAPADPGAAGAAGSVTDRPTDPADDNPAPAQADSDLLGFAPSGSTASTTLDTDFTKPSVTAPGDGPADTTDPLERAQSVTPIPGPEALVAGTVNAVVPAQLPVKPPRDESKDRFEEYEALTPNGATVRVRRNLETGDSAVIAVVALPPSQQTLG